MLQFHAVSRCLSILDLGTWWVLDPGFPAAGTRVDPNQPDFPFSKLVHFFHQNLNSCPVSCAIRLGVLLAQCEESRKAIQCLHTGKEFPFVSLSVFLLFLPCRFGGPH